MTSIVICGKCGHEYRRVTWARNQKKKIVWRCNNRLINGKDSRAESVTIEERVLNHAVMSAIHKIARNEGDFVGAYRENVIRIIGNYGQAKEKDEYEDKIKEKQQEMVDLIAENAKTGAYSEAFDQRLQTITEEIKKLKDRNKAEETAYKRP